VRRLGTGSEFVIHVSARPRKGEISLPGFWQDDIQWDLYFPDDAVREKAAKAKDQLVAVEGTAYLFWHAVMGLQPATVIKVTSLEVLNARK
jgi:hypothetical protein